MTVDAITPVAQDYLKAIWSATEWGQAPITTKALAERFGTSAANVTDTVRRLAAQGLVDYTPYRPVRLTPAGIEHAVTMVRRHRLLEAFLVEVLDYRWDEVHEEAERLEHAVTLRLIERIDAALGHPATDPHGDPIPTADGTVRTPSGARQLTELTEAGRYRVVRVSDSDPDVLPRAEELNLVPGAVITVELDPALRLVGGPAIPRDVAMIIWVIPRRSWRVSPTRRDESATI